MPNTATEWAFWVFSTIFLALIIGIGVNLITPRVKDTGEGWLQKRRLKHESYRKQLEKMSKRLDENPAEIFLFFVGQLSAYGLAFLMIVNMAVAGVTVIVILSLRTDGQYFIDLQPWLRLLLCLLIGSFSGGLFLYVYFKVLRIVRTANDLWSIYYKRKRAERDAKVENAQVEMIDSP